MRVLLITAYFPPEIGSASHLYHELGVALSELGHEVTVLTTLPGYNVEGALSQYRRKLWVDEQMDGLRVVRVASPRLPRGLMFGRALWQFGTAIGLAAAAIAIKKQDVAIVYSPPLPLGLSALAVKALKGTPLVLNVQDLFPQSVIDLGLLKNRKLIRMFEKMESFLYSRADLITVHSRDNGAHVIAKGALPEKIEVIPNWVDTDAIVPRDDGAEFRAKLGLNGEFVVSFGGVVAYSQDLDVILEAALVLRDHSDIRWLIVGDGVEKDRLVSLAKAKRLDNVTFLPMLPRHEYPGLLHASDVCLATLRAEVKTPVVPSKIMSIMAAGKPVLASMNLDGDAPRLIHDADCGEVVSPGNAIEMAEAVLKLRSDGRLRARLGSNGRAYAERHLSLKSAAQTYSAILSQLGEAVDPRAQRTQ